MASARFASYIEEEDWDINTLELVNSHLENYLKMVSNLLIDGKKIVLND